MEALVAVVGIISTLLATIITQTLTSRREKRRLELENERLALEIKKFEVEHPQITRIEFDIDCRFYGPIGCEYIAEFSMSLDNKGTEIIKLTGLVLRIRGIKEGEKFKTFQSDSRLSFPHKILEEDVIPPAYNYYFVESGTQQIITFVTRLPSEYKFVVAHAKFEYDEYTPHTTERLFEVT